MLLVTGCASFEQRQEWSVDAFDGGWPEKAMIDARQRYSDINDNCSQVVRLAQTTLAKAGIKSTYIHHHRR
jgi:hypothetical protein